MVVSAMPAGPRTALDSPIQVLFNRPMNQASVEAAFTIQPTLVGAFTWDADGRSFVYRPTEPFERSTNYLVRILGSARDRDGGGLDGNFNHTREDSPADDFTWKFRFKVSNDDFADATLVAGTVGSTPGDNRNTTWDVLEPQLSARGALIRHNTVWYRWKIIETNWTTFDLTGGTSFDTILDVFQGDEITSLLSVTSNDDYGSSARSRVSWLASAGATYSIRVSGKDSADPSQSGPFTLAWYPTPAPGFTGPQFSPLRSIPGAKVTLFGTNFTGATAVVFNGVTAVFTNTAGSVEDLRITAVVPPQATTGPITIVTPHGNVTSSASFQVLPPALSGVAVSQGQIQLRWAATSSTFTLEASDNLWPAHWVPVQQAPVRENGESKVNLLALNAMFYRLRSD